MDLPGWRALRLRPWLSTRTSENLISRLLFFFRYDRKLLGELAGCAWRALKHYFEAYFDGDEVTPGAVGFLQTSGELLNFHPHVHLLVTDGGFGPTGIFRPLRPGPSSP